MTGPKIPVTGATGKTAGAVVNRLPARGIAVRAVVRWPDTRSAALERQGAETIAADMFDFDPLRAAMRGKTDHGALLQEPGWSITPFCKVL